MLFVGFRLKQEQQKDKLQTESSFVFNCKSEPSVNGTNNIKKIIVKDKKINLYDKWDSNIKL